MSDFLTAPSRFPRDRRRAPAYAYRMGAVLFKPTLPVNPQTFRATRAGALAYFVGGDPSFPKDKGFALKG